jgi:uncharacterized membrane protein
MAAAWEPNIQKWVQAGVIDEAAAARIREFEGREGRSGGLRWPAILAITLGGIMLAAGVLLFVSAHWEDMAPSTRFAIVVLMVLVFHAAGAYAGQKMEPLAMVLHGIGTASLGAGIYLSGQIFNLSEHWPGGVLMWAVGAWIGWVLRGDWVQLTFAAILTPAWVGSEWVDAHNSADAFAARILLEGLVMIAITYFTAPRSRPLVWLGGLTLLPLTIALACARAFSQPDYVAPHHWFVGYALAFVIPLGVAYMLRGDLVWINAVAAAWVLVLGIIARDSTGWLPYLWCGLGATGLVAWGMAERRGERINLGMAGFAITILLFYFSSVMDKIGRSASLIGLGVLFLAGGWALEKVRRKLVSQMRAAT